MIIGVRISSTATPATMEPKSSAQNVSAGDESFAGILSEASTSPAAVSQVIEARPTTEAENGLASGVASNPLEAQVVSSSRMLQTPTASRLQPSNAGRNLTTAGLQSQADQRTVNRKGTDQAGPQSQPSDKNDNAIGTVAIPPPVQINPPDAKKSPAQENGDSSDAQPSKAAVSDANVENLKDASDLPVLPGSKSQPDASALKQNEASQDPLVEATPTDANADADSAACSDSNGMADLAAGLIGINTEPLLLDPIPLPMTAAPSSIARGVQKNSAQGAGTDPLNLKSSTLVSTSNSGASKSGESGTNSVDLPIRGVQSSQADSSQSDAHTLRVPDNVASALQSQTAVSQSASPETIITTPAAVHPGEGLHLGAQQEVPASIVPDGTEAMATSSISAAKLLQTMNETEMRIGISSSDFGDISIRTSVSNHQMLAQISLDHSELSQVISAHASSVQAKLGDEYGLHTTIEINNLASFHSGDLGQSSKQNGGTPTGSLPTESISAPAEEERSVMPGAILVAGAEYRLDIRA